ncbi:MAG: PIN domain-containing protein, partial [Acidobacteria bacterium]|nr:PIN domain-containing protein [Acidobacteriota bacterium]
EGAEKSAALIRRCETGKVGGYECVVTLSEITTIILREGRQSDLESVLSGMREDFSLVNITPEIAVLSGVLKSRYAAARKGFSLADSLICAAAQIMDLPLVTYDSEFDRVTEVDVRKPDHFC